MKKEWFADWFDSPYYHLLYKNRDDKEAQTFMNALSQRLHFQEDHHLLDLACGKGRHSIYLNNCGFKVTGVDLSPQSIQHAQQFQNEKLNFETHDMRNVYKKGEFDFVLNMFTSFGYFDNNEDNVKAITAMQENLKEEGTLVIDFMNVHKIIKNLVKEEVKQVESTTFNLNRSVVNGYITKDIRFTAEGKEYHYQEKVQAITREMFEDYFEKANLKVIDIFGDFHLNEFNLEESNRMIFILKKS